MTKGFLATAVRYAETKFWKKMSSVMMGITFLKMDAIFVGSNVARGASTVRRAFVSNVCLRIS